MPRRSTAVEVRASSTMAQLRRRQQCQAQHCRSDREEEDGNNYEVDLDAKTQTQSKPRNMRDFRCVTQLLEVLNPSRLPRRAADFLLSIPTLVLQRDVPALVEGMHTHVEAPQVQQAGCKALMSMATSVRVKVKKRILYLVSFMRCEFDDLSLARSLLTHPHSCPFPPLARTHEATG